MTISRSLPIILSSSLALLLLPGCPSDDGDTGADDSETNGDDVDTDSDTTAGIEVDDQMILDAVANYQSDFTLINAAPQASGAHAGGGIDVNIYVNPVAEDAYRAVDPDNLADASMPVGTIIVKEHLDGMGGVSASTVMYKAEAGYNPEFGDWWWGVGDLLGGSLNASGQNPGMCTGCHVSVSQSDYVYGVPAGNQTP